MHLYGCIRHDLLLRFLLGSGEIDWTPYVEAYEAAYAERPDPAALIEGVRKGRSGCAEAFRELFVFGDADADGFERFQAKFNLLIAASEISRLRQGCGDPAALAAELCSFIRAILADHAQQGIRHAEFRMMLPVDLPSDLARPSLELVASELSRGPAMGVDARLALSLPRADPWTMWERIQASLSGEPGQYISAIDFSAAEEGHPPSDQREFFDAVRAHNEAHPRRALAILYHVGESFADKSLESAVRWVHEAAELGAHRLGHAIALGVEPQSYGEHCRQESVSERRDQLRYDLAHATGLERHGVRVDRRAVETELRLLDRPGSVKIVYDAVRLEEVRRRQVYALEEVRRSGAVIEVCPTSNRRIAGIVEDAHHPLHRFHEAGLRLVIASDDPGLFDIRLIDELDWVRRTLELAPEELDHLRQASWECRSEVLSGRQTRR